MSSKKIIDALKEIAPYLIVDILIRLFLLKAMKISTGGTLTIRNVATEALIAVATLELSKYIEKVINK